MGLFSIAKPAPTDVVEALTVGEERFAAGLHEDFDSALFALKQVRLRAAQRAAELHDLSLASKHRAKYLEEQFRSE